MQDQDKGPIALLPIRLAREAPFRLGLLQVNPATRELTGPSGSAVLQPRVMQVLVALSRAHGQVVSRDELVQSCWDGLFVGDDAVTRVIGLLRTKFAQVGADCTLQTVARVGYRLTLDQPVDGDVGPRVSAPPPEPGAVRQRASIAVWPFATLTGGGDQDYFADGMVEEITTALSRYASLFVVASGSSRSSREQGLDPTQAASRLGVRYVLEGSVRRSAGRVRIAVKLIDSEAGAHIWAERFEDTLDDIFALQDRVATAVAGVIEPKLLVAEMRRAARRPTDSADSYDLYLRAVPLVQSFKVDEQKAALRLLERAIELDPEFGRALGAASFAHALLYEIGPREEGEFHHAKGLELARRSLQVGGEEPEVLAWTSDALVQLGQDLNTAITLNERARELNPGSAYVWFVSGTFKIMMGDAEGGLADIAQSQRLDPMSWIRANMLNWMAMARFTQGRYHEAVELLLEARQLKSSYPTNPPVLAASYAQLGDLAAARAALAGVRFSRRRAVAWADHLFRQPEHRQRFLAGLTAAIAEG